MPIASAPAHSMSWVTIIWSMTAAACLTLAAGHQHPTPGGCSVHDGQHRLLFTDY